MPLSEEDDGKADEWPESLHPKAPHPDFAPPPVRAGDGISGQRVIFGESFSDPNMAYSEFELRHVENMSKVAYDIDFLLEESGLEETVKLRFIQGCEWDVHTAAESLREHLEWRASLMPTNSLPVLKDTGESFIYWHGNDKHFRPVLMIHCQRLNKMREANGGSIEFIEEGVIECMSYFLAHLIKPGIIEQLVVIVDLNECNAWDAPIDFVQRIAKLLTSNYRARLNKLYVINTPLLFYAFWRVAKCFVPERTACKVEILRSVYIDTLLDQIEYDHLDPDVIPYEDESITSSKSSDSS